jgi:hypothetical protein
MRDSGECCDRSSGVQNIPILFSVSFRPRPGERYPLDEDDQKQKQRLKPIDENAWRDSHIWPYNHRRYGDGVMSAYTSFNFHTYDESLGKWVNMDSNEDSDVWMKTERQMLERVRAYAETFFCVACQEFE